MGESGTIDRKRLLIRLRPFMYGVWGYPFSARGSQAQAISERPFCRSLVSMTGEI